MKSLCNFFSVNQSRYSFYTCSMMLFYVYLFLISKRYILIFNTFLSIKAETLIFKKIFKFLCTFLMQIQLIFYTDTNAMNAFFKSFFKVKAEINYLLIMQNRYKIKKCIIKINHNFNFNFSYI